MINRKKYKLTDKATAKTHKVTHSGRLSTNKYTKKRTNRYINMDHYRTAFGYAAIAALIIGLGSVVATTTDIYWVMGDMSVQQHSHHIPVLIGLLVSDVVMITSFVYLFFGIRKYITVKVKNNRHKTTTRDKIKYMVDELNIDGE